MHSGVAVVDLLFEIDPELTILWAHAGMSEPAGVVEAAMARYPKLYADISFREWNIYRPEGVLDEAWKRLLYRFPDRFLVGSDTYVNAQWAAYGVLIQRNRDWLSLLPDDIAYRNGLKLFGLSE